MDTKDTKLLKASQEDATLSVNELAKKLIYLHHHAGEEFRHLKKVELLLQK